MVEGGTLVIGNPRAGKGTVRRRWEDLLERLERSGLQPTGELTDGPGHAAELADKARSDRRAMVVAVGGDGTVHEVVNGLLTQGTEERVPVLGVIPAGSGCDYARSFSLPNDLDAAAACLSSPRAPRVVDVGEVRCQGIDGERRRLFANVAEVGIGADVAYRASRLPRAFGPARYVGGFALTLPRHRPTDARVVATTDHYRGRLTNLVVAIGQYFGAGMHIAPAADLSDGEFDVQVQFGSKLDYALSMPKLFRGTHLPHPRVLEWRAGTVEVSCDPAARLEADGELLGTTPASFRILPGALRVKI